MDPVKVRLEVDDEINALARRAVASINVRFGNLARVTSSGFVGRKRIEMSVHGGGGSTVAIVSAIVPPRHRAHRRGRRALLRISILVTAHLVTSSQLYRLLYRGVVVASVTRYGLIVLLTSSHVRV